jgi:predicted nucleic acid-binding protein
VLPLTEGTANAYAVVRLAVKQKGTPIPANDAWIAAIALEHGLPVLSRDTHFDSVPRVKRQSW